MEIIHRIVFSDRDKIDDILDYNRIKYTKKFGYGEKSYLIIIEIPESDINWSILSTLVKEKGALDIFDTTFTKEEILGAEWSLLKPNFEQGYPLPKNGWEKLVYGDSVRPLCGIGFCQIGAFHIAKEPFLRKKDFYRPIWTYVLFCTNPVIRQIAENRISGVEIREVIIHNTKLTSQVVSQLIFPHVTEPILGEIDKNDPWTCPLCGITKYAYHKRGYMHLHKSQIRYDLDAQVTYEWFGTGTATGHREFIISNRFATQIIENQWQGITLKPIKLI
jgi:hypothetical protein